MKKESYRDFAEVTRQWDDWELIRGCRFDYDEAAVDNLDLALPAGGGREAFLSIAHKMADAPPR
eukprot:5157394-Amphidinium_carterae.3